MATLREAPAKTIDPREINGVLEYDLTRARRVIDHPEIYCDKTTPEEEKSGEAYLASWPVCNMLKRGTVKIPPCITTKKGQALFTADEITFRHARSQWLLRGGFEELGFTTRPNPFSESLSDERAKACQELMSLSPKEVGSFLERKTQKP